MWLILIEDVLTPKLSLLSQCSSPLFLSTSAFIEHLVLTNYHRLPPWGLCPPFVTGSVSPLCVLPADRSPSHCSLTHSKGIRQEGKRGEEVMTMRRRRKADGPGKKLLCCPQTESYGAKMMDALLLISSVGWETPLSPLTIFFVSMCV